MPNWCNGLVVVRGKPQNIENFCQLFLFTDREDKDELTELIDEKVNGKDKIKDKYFARSFIDSKWKDFKDEELGRDEVSFNVNFAWSCNSCLIEGYPDKDNDCVTLEWACKKFDVEVDIETEEEDLGFEEKIIYTKEEGLIYDSVEMPTYKCKKCGEKQLVATYRDIEEVNCYNCGEEGQFEEIESKEGEE